MVTSDVLASYVLSPEVESGGAGGIGGGSGGPTGGSPVVPSANAMEEDPKNGAPHARKAANTQTQIATWWLFRLIFTSCRLWLHVAGG